MSGGVKDIKPRRVSVRWGAICGLVVAYSLAPLWCYYFYFEVKSEVEYAEGFQKFGINDVGIIEGKYIQRFKHGVGYHVVYSFSVKTDSNMYKRLHNDNILNNEIGPGAIYWDLEIGDSVPIIYRKDDPKINSINIKSFWQADFDKIQRKNFWRIFWWNAMFWLIGIEAIFIFFNLGKYRRRYLV